MLINKMFRLIDKILGLEDLVPLEYLMLRISNSLLKELSLNILPIFKLIFSVLIKSISNTLIVYINKFKGP